VTPRLRLFAGPNGSGKSVLKSYLPPKLLGIYLNPDEIEAEIRAAGGLDLGAIKVDASSAEVLSFFTDSAFLKSQGLQDPASLLRFNNGWLDFTSVEMNSYLASVTVDFLRQWYLREQVSFTFESVMSHPDKVKLMANAQKAGYRTYLYFVATDDPEINVSRVHNRVALGGHSVPESKIVSRYYRSTELLMDAIKYTNRAYIFDNSTDNVGADHTWLAEITDGKTMELKTDLMPSWFKKAVLDKIQ
jgi:predicted ABC-type ATPase